MPEDKRFDNIKTVAIILLIIAVILLLWFVPKPHGISTVPEIKIVYVTVTQPVPNCSLAQITPGEGNSGGQSNGGGSHTGHGGSSSETILPTVVPTSTLNVTPTEIPVTTPTITPTITSPIRPIPEFPWIG